ncbi:alpha-glucosidase, partial [termite gut metagenome]
MKNKFVTTTLFACLFVFSMQAQKQFTLTSPNGRIAAAINIGDKLTYSVTHDGQTVIDASPLSLTLSTGEIWGDKARLSKSNTRNVKNNITSPFYRKDK